jgi:hypothetical protein
VEVSTGGIYGMGIMRTTAFAAQEWSASVEVRARESHEAVLLDWWAGD